MKSFVDLARRLGVRPAVRRRAATLLALPGFAVSTALSAAEFGRDVSPVLARECVSCHGAEKQKGGLRLDRRDDALKGGEHGALWLAGNADGSLLIQVVEGRHAEVSPMPRKKPPLATNEIAALRAWITAGAVWPEGVTVAEAARAGTNWWSLQPLGSEQPPTPERLPAGWDGPIDRFIFAGLAARGLRPSPPAERRALIRRVTYDVLGLPPSPEEIESFVQDRSAQAYERLIDRLLASPRYGERWGRLWLDVVRFGESNGYERNVLWADAWPFRDYVIRSLNEDKPFDRFITEHLAGDSVAAGGADAVGTAFLVCGPYDDVGNQDPMAAAQIRANHLDDMVRATSEAFLGLTVGCARCHNHKFDPISTEDYYRIQSAFGGVWHGSRTLATAEERARRTGLLKPLESERDRLRAERDAIEKAVIERAHVLPAQTNFALPAPDPYFTEDRFATVEVRALRMRIDAGNRDPKGGVSRIDEFEVWSDEPTPRNVALVSAGARVDGGAGRAAEDFAGAYGVEFVQDGRFDAKWLAAPHATLTITFARPERVNRVSFSADRQRALPREHGENSFVGEYRIEVSADGTNWVSVTDSAQRAPVNDAFARRRAFKAGIRDSERDAIADLERQLGAVNEKIGAVPPLPHAWAGDFRAPPTNMFVLLGGDPQRRGRDVVPSSPEFLPAVNRFALAADAGDAARRLALARWVVSADNPLPLRVLANRVWQSHFGTGLVETPNDFGWLGGRPSNAALLDWLAQRLAAHGWRLKPLHREILLSATYRQSAAEPVPNGGGVDPRSVDAGDRLLWRFPPRRLSAEELRDTLLAVAGKLDLRPGGPGFRLYRYLEDNVATYVPLETLGPETYRRAVYHQNPRSARVDLLGDFDCPDNAVSAPARVLTTSPLQALTLLNHRFTLDMAAALAARIRGESSNDDDRAIDRLFALTFGRAATAPEREAARALAQKHGWPALCRAQLNANEFLFID
jgi:mono/diheme cytochrome c family protein